MPIQIYLIVLSYILYYCGQEISFTFNFLLLQGNAEENRVRERSSLRSKEGFRGLTKSNKNVETEDQQREKEHNDVKVFDLVIHRNMLH